MNRTKSGINYKLLLTKKDDRYIQLFEQVVDQAVSMYQPFNFKDKLDVVVFFSERKDFSHFVFTEFAIIEDVYEDGNSIHHSYGFRSIIGIKVEALHLDAPEVSTDVFFDHSPTSRLTKELGYAIEDFKLHVNGWRLTDQSERAGYRIWVEFFSQAHASRWRKESNQSPDCYMNAFLTLLVKKERTTNPEDVRESFQLMISSMGDLYYYWKYTKPVEIEAFMISVENFTDSTFREYYEELFSILNNYMEKIGFNYNALHEKSIFEELERTKDKIVNHAFLCPSE